MSKRLFKFVCSELKLLPIEIKFFYACQVISVFVLIFFNIYVNVHIEQLLHLKRLALHRLDSSNDRLGGWRVGEEWPHKAVRLPRAAGFVKSPLHQHDTWLQLSQHFKVQKSVMNDICSKIHLSCTTKGKKIRGAPGFRGLIGLSGPPGGSGKMGQIGTSGNPGIAGLVGPPGKNGRDGTCNCSSPDVVLKKLAVIALSGPPPYPASVTPPGPAIEKTEVSETHKPPVVITKPAPGPIGVTAPFNPNDTDLQSVGSLTPPPMTGMPSVTSSVTHPSPTGCVLDVVGTPILHAESPFGPVGAWMRDAQPDPSADTEPKRWVMDGYATPVLYEFKDEQDLIRKRQLIKYYMNYLIVGTGAVVLNGSFYYHRYNSPSIVKYDLNAAEEKSVSIPNMAYEDCVRRLDDNDENEGFEECDDGSQIRHYLYGMRHNFADLAIDENGLWVVYVNVFDPQSLGVVKLDATTLQPTGQWVVSSGNSSLNVSSLANTFVMCGVLYGLRSGADRSTWINFAYDLYSGREMTSFEPVHWPNPFQGNSMLDYNPFDRRIYFYDNGHLLSTSVGVKFF